LVRLRPEAAVWSALEYACHVRDALALYDWRIGKALSEDRPDFPPMGRDDLADERRYNDQNPLLVIGELVAGAERLADLLAPVQGPTWDRSGVREGQELTVAWMAKNVLHECEHHLLDIGRVLRRVRGR
jgi:S-DNA-T family DNA segregation ATPase FtsK/SpoIIIE